MLLVALNLDSDWTVEMWGGPESPGRVALPEREAIGNVGAREEALLSKDNCSSVPGGYLWNNVFQNFPWF